MIKLLPALNIKKLKSYADWRLLLFLVLFLNVKLAVKIPAIVIIYLLQFDFKFGFSLKNSRLPLFYLAMLIVPFVDLFLTKGYLNTSYLIVFLNGIGFWLLCILAIHQVKLSVERNEPELIHNTIFLFLLLNTIVTLLNIGAIIWKIGEINPYTYQGQHQKYFIGTGDYIKGLTFDTSTTNAILNAFGLVYFLVRKNAVMVLFCMATLLLTASNFTNIILLLVLGLLFLFRSNRDQKSLIVVCMAFLGVFMLKISPQNDKYVNETFTNIFHRKPVIIAHSKNEIPVTQKPDSILTTEEKREKIAQLYLDSLAQITTTKQKPPAYLPLVEPDLMTETGRILLPKANIHTEPYQRLQITPPEQRPLLTFISTHKTVLPMSGQLRYNTSLPGRAVSFLQTFDFLKQHPEKIVAGAGIGNFSSKLAFRATGLNISGGYPAKYTYINSDFEENHLDLYLNYFSKHAGYHSMANSPFSVYDQLLAEYGLMGLFALLVLYLGFFAKHYKTLTYGLPILLITTAILLVDYWFEQLSVLVFFELLLFLNIKETTVAHAS
jgi:hypothetical protein